MDVLTPREREILDLVASGWTNTAIAHALRISPRTVAKHLEHAYRKLGVTNRAAAVFQGYAGFAAASSAPGSSASGPTRPSPDSALSAAGSARSSVETAIQAAVSSTSLATS